MLPSEPLPSLGDGAGRPRDDAEGPSGRGTRRDLTAGLGSTRVPHGNHRPEGEDGGRSAGREAEPPPGPWGSGRTPASRPRSDAPTARRALGRGRPPLPPPGSYARTGPSVQLPTTPGRASRKREGGRKEGRDRGGGH